MVRNTSIGRSQCNWWDLPSNENVMGKTNGRMGSLCISCSHGKFCSAKTSLRLKEEKSTLNLYLTKHQLFLLMFWSMASTLHRNLCVIKLSCWSGSTGDFSCMRKNRAHAQCGVTADITARLLKIRALYAITAYDMWLCWWMYSF